MQTFRLTLWFCFLALLTSTTLVYSSLYPSENHEVIELLRKHKVQLIVMRHGEATHNLEHLMTSSRSPGIYLTEKGIKQVKHSAHHLLRKKIDQIYVSPVFRTLQTAQIVAHQLDLPYQDIVVEDALREQFFGELEDQTYQTYQTYFSSPEDVFVDAPPGGESGSSLFARTQELLLRIANQNHNQTVLLVTHAYNCCQISRCLTGSYDDIPLQAEYKIYDFSDSN